MSAQTPQYQVGDIVNGHRWTGTEWEPITDITGSDQPEGPAGKRRPWWKWALSLGVMGLTFLLAQWVLGGQSDKDTTQRDESGSITESGEVGVFKLQVGDCISESQMRQMEGTDEIIGVDHLDSVPCSESHVGEVILVDEEYFATRQSMPPSEQLVADAAEACVVSVAEYTGQPYDTSPYDVMPLVPTEQGWNTVDDRGLVCVGFTLAENREDIIATTGSIRAG
jgi:hypothetical protein